MTTNEFNRLSEAKRRMLIAADVLATLRLPKKRRYRVAPGTYCEAKTDKPIFADPTRQLQTLLPKFERDCKVCGIGALFLSHVRVANDVTIEAAAGSAVNTDTRFNADDDRMVELLDYFEDGQLRIIEAAFEGNRISSMVSYDDWQHCRGWRERYSTPTKRLRAICRNIIRNKGDFMPKDLPGRGKIEESEREAA